MNEGSKIIAEPKDRAECLLKLLATQMDHLCQTRDIEFKVNLALWALVVLAGKFAYSEPLLRTHWPWFLCFGVSLTLGHLFFWMIPIQKSEETDDYFILLYRWEIEQLSGHQVSERPNKKKAGIRWILFEAGITALLAVAATVALALS